MSDIAGETVDFLEDCELYLSTQLFTDILGAIGMRHPDFKQRRREMHDFIIAYRTNANALQRVPRTRSCDTDELWKKAGN